MHPRRSHLFMLLLILLSPPALADGNALLNRCQAALEFAQSGRTGARADMAYCYGLLQGIRELNALYERKNPGQAYFCLSAKHIRHRQAAELVVRYLEAHRNRLHQNESTLAVQAFRNAYPCEGKR